MKDPMVLFPRGLIVSCQALEHEPLHGSEIMAKMAVAAKVGRRCGYSCQHAAGHPRHQDGCGPSHYRYLQEGL